MRRPEFIAEQSRRPTGALGWIIGKIMSHETESLNSATLSALDLQPSDRVLEIGFGHGRTIHKAAEAVPMGVVAGVDFSETMLGMARRRCAALIESGRVQLALGDSAALPFPEQSFDKVYSVHTIYFWKEPLAHLREIHRVLEPGGRFALAFRTRTAGSGSEAFPDSVYTFRDVDTVRALLRESGFELGSVRDAGPGMVLLLSGKDAASHGETERGTPG